MELREVIIKGTLLGTKARSSPVMHHPHTYGKYNRKRGKKEFLFEEKGKKTMGVANGKPQSARKLERLEKGGTDNHPWLKGG